MKITDTKNVYKVELTKEEMEAIYLLSLDEGIDALLKYGGVSKDSALIGVIESLHIDASKVLYGTDE